MKLSLTSTPGASEFAPILLRGSPRQAFELARKTGLQGVELHLRRPEDVDPEEIVRLCREHELAVPTLGTGMAAGQDGLTFSSPDASVREKAVDIIRRHIDLAAQIGSGVTIGLIFGSAGREPAERRRRMGYAVSCMKECAEHAARRGVKLFLEPLNRYESDCLNRLEEAAEVAAGIGGDSVRLLADTFHMNIEEPDPAQAVRQFGGLLGHVHLVDSNREAPGHGHADLGSVVAALRGAGFQGFLSFEILPRPEAMRALEDAAACARGLLA